MHVRLRGGAREREHLVQQRNDRLHHGGMHIASADGEQAPGQSAALLHGPIDDPELLSRRRSFTLERGDADANDRQQIVEVVRHAAGDLAGEIEVPGLCHPLLDRGDLGDVLEDDDAAPRCSTTGTQWRHVPPDDAARATVVKPRPTHIAKRVAVAERRQQRVALGDVREELVPIHAAVGRDAKQCAGRHVGDLQGAGCVDLGDADRRRPEDRRELVGLFGGATMGLIERQRDIDDPAARERRDECRNHQGRYEVREQVLGCPLEHDERDGRQPQGGHDREHCDEQLRASAPQSYERPVPRKAEHHDAGRYPRVPAVPSQRIA